MRLKSYISPAGLDPTQLDADIALSGSVNEFEGIKIEDKILSVLGGSVEDESALDTVLTNAGCSLIDCLTLKDTNGVEWAITVDPEGVLMTNKKLVEDAEVDYKNRNKERESTLASASIKMVAYYMQLGDNQKTAEGKIGQISNEIKADLRPYELGNTRVLKRALQNIISLPFFDQPAKDHIISQL